MRPKKAEAPLTLGESNVVLQIDFTIIEPLAVIGFIKVGEGLHVLVGLGRKFSPCYCVGLIIVIAWVSSCPEDIQPSCLSDTLHGGVWQTKPRLPLHPTSSLTVCKLLKS